jgi:multicomponent Na+:H+ antiporter subunit D
MTAEMTGDDSQVEQRENRIRQRTRYLAYPVGGGVFLAVVFLAVMSVLYFN